MPLGEENVQHFLASGRIQHRHARYLRHLLYHLVAVAQLGGSRHLGKVRIVYHAGYLQAGVYLHLLLKMDYLLNRAGQRAADVHNIQHFKRAWLEVNKVLMIAAKRSGTHSVAADIEHDRVPIHVKRGGDLRRQA